MNALGKFLGEGLDVRREAKILRVRREFGVWEVEIENQASWRAGRLVLTAPVPQSLALLKAGDVELPKAWADGLAALTYHPCLALLVTLGGVSAVPAEGVALTEGPVRWIADNTKKGVAPGVPAAVTVHLNPAFAAEHYAKTETELAALVLPGIERWLGAPVVGVALHRWKFSEPTATFAEPCVWRPELGLGLAGDAFGGPRVEALRVGDDDFAGECVRCHEVRDVLGLAGVVARRGTAHDATPWPSASSSRCWMSTGPLAALRSRQNVSSRSCREMFSSARRWSPGRSGGDTSRKNNCTGSPSRLSKWSSRIGCGWPLRSTNR
jgi:hypothetical protein